MVSTDRSMARLVDDRDKDKVFGFMGVWLTPAAMRHDVVCVLSLNSSRTPLVMRHTGNGYFTILGRAICS